MLISKQKIENAYQKNAKYYDFALKVFYPLIGLKIGEYRKKAVNYLALKEGDIVVDLGCGTGLCFPLLMEKIGSNGKLIGVDISSEMLSIAEDKVKSASWDNVDLINSDIEMFEFPDEINAVISTGVFGYLEEREKVLEKINKSLLNNGKVVIVDGKKPERWPSFLFKLFVKLSKSYGLTDSYFDNNTPDLVSRLFKNVILEDMYGGLLYITSGEKNEKIA